MVKEALHFFAHLSFALSWYLVFFSGMLLF